MWPWKIYYSALCVYIYKMYLRRVYGIREYQNTSIHTETELSYLPTLRGAPGLSPVQSVIRTEKVQRLYRSRADFNFFTHNTAVLSDVSIFISFLDRNPYPTSTPRSTFTPRAINNRSIERTRCNIIRVLYYNVTGTHKRTLKPLK